MISLVVPKNKMVLSLVLLSISRSIYTFQSLQVIILLLQQAKESPRLQLNKMQFFMPGLNIFPRTLNYFFINECIYYPVGFVCSKSVDTYVCGFFYVMFPLFIAVEADQAMFYIKLIKSKMNCKRKNLNGKEISSKYTRK